MLLSRLRLLVVISTLALLTSSAPHSAQAEIFVTNDGSESVTVYPNNATGDQAPLRKITFSGQPRGIAVDTVNGEIFVATQSGSVLVFGINATGAATPLREITGGGDYQGVAVDTVNNEIFVANRNDGTIEVYARLADGAATPVRTLDVGDEPRGVFVNVAANELYVTRSNEVSTYLRTASGTDAALRTISPTTSVGDLSQVTLDTTRAQLVVANHENDAIRVWPVGADGDVDPVRSILGSATLLDSPRGVAICSGAEYIVPARNEDRLTAYAASASGDVPPLRTITGSATELDSPRFVAVTGTCGGSSAAPMIGPLGLALLVALFALIGIRHVTRNRRNSPIRAAE
jgi:DNA-binding beta-propeller fold protein YncE